jgi:hypothetical protein
MLNFAFSQHMLQKWSVHVVGLDFKCFRPVILLSSSFFTDVVGLDLICFNHYIHQLNTCCSSSVLDVAALNVKCFILVKYILQQYCVDVSQSDFFVSHYTHVGSMQPCFCATFYIPLSPVR